MNFKAPRKSPWRIERDTISFDVTLMTNGCASCIWKMIYLILFRIGWWIWMKCHLEALALIQRVTRVNTQRNSNRFFLKPTWSYTLFAQCEVALTEVEKKTTRCWDPLMQKTFAGKRKYLLELYVHELP